MVSISIFIVLFLDQYFNDVILDNVPKLYLPITLIMCSNLASMFFFYNNPYCIITSLSYSTIWSVFNVNLSANDDCHHLDGQTSAGIFHPVAPSSFETSSVGKSGISVIRPWVDRARALRAHPRYVTTLTYYSQYTQKNYISYYWSPI